MPRVHDIFTFTMILDTAIRQQPQHEAPVFAEKMVEYVTTLAAKGKSELEPVVTRTTLVPAWAKSGLEEAPYRAEQVIDRIYRNLERSFGCLGKE